VTISAAILVGLGMGLIGGFLGHLIVMSDHHESQDSGPEPVNERNTP